MLLEANTFIPTKGCDTSTLKCINIICIIILSALKFLHTSARKPIGSNFGGPTDVAAKCNCIRVVVRLFVEKKENYYKVAFNPIILWPLIHIWSDPRPIQCLVVQRLRKSPLDKENHPTPNCLPFVEEKIWYSKHQENNVEHLVGYSLVFSCKWL